MSASRSRTTSSGSASTMITGAPRVPPAPLSAPSSSCALVVAKEEGRPQYVLLVREIVGQYAGDQPASRPMFLMVVRGNPSRAITRQVAVITSSRRASQSTIFGISSPSGVAGEEYQARSIDLFRTSVYIPSECTTRRSALGTWARAILGSGYVRRAELSQMRDDGIAFGRRAVSDGLITGTAGNFSIRVGEVMAITPSGVPYDLIDPSEVCRSVSRMVHSSAVRTHRARRRCTARPMLPPALVQWSIRIRRSSWRCLRSWMSYRLCIMQWRALVDRSAWPHMRSLGLRSWRRWPSRASRVGRPSSCATMARSRMATLSMKPMKGVDTRVAGDGLLARPHVGSADASDDPQLSEVASVRASRVGEEA